MTPQPTDRSDAERSTIERRRLLRGIDASPTEPAAESERVDAEPSTIDRRRLLQGIAATGLATAAGCLNNDDDDTGDDGADDGGADPGEIQDGGRLEFAIKRSGIDVYDQADSSLADDSTVFNAVYDHLFEQNTEGELFLWMAEAYEATGAQDVSAPGGYVDYMGEYEIDDVQDGVPFLAVEWPNLVLMHHPDDMAAVQSGDLGAGDAMRVLTREEAADAVADGVYGTRVEGRLHEGIEFHDGEECTAGNVVGSYDRYVGSDNEGQLFNAFLHAEMPEGADGYEFVLYSQEPDAIADIQLPPFQIFPSAHLDVRPGELDPRDGGPVPIGTGPYEVEEFEEGSQLLLKRTDSYWLEEVGLENKDWWDGPEDFPAAPAIDEINVRFVPEAGTRTAALQDGDVDLAYDLSAGDRNAFDSSDEFSVSSATSTGFRFWQFPVQETDEGGALAHQEIRQAINALMPRQDIVDIVLEGWGAPARVPFPEPAAGAGTTMSYEEIEQQEWAFPVEPDVERAEELIEQSPLEPPIELVIETNADDDARQDKVQIAIDEFNQSGLFDATLETPADIGDWTTQSLYVEGSGEEYARRNAGAVIGLAAGFDPHGYAEALHHPDNHNICCNFFNGEGSFDFIDLLDSCRYGVDVAEDPDLRRERYDQLWEEIATVGANLMMDFSVETTVAGPELRGYRAYPDVRRFLDYGLHAPYDEQVAWLDR